MAFSKINDHTFLIDENGEIIKVVAEKFLYHNAIFHLIRETNTQKNVNLFRVLNQFRDIVVYYKQEHPEVDEFFFQFFPNEVIDTQKWIDICEFYLKRQKVNVSRMGPLLVARFLE